MNCLLCCALRTISSATGAPSVIRAGTLQAAEAGVRKGGA